MSAFKIQRKCVQQVQIFLLRELQAFLQKVLALMKEF